MNFEQVPEFQKDLKRLGKKWKSLPKDIQEAQLDLAPLYLKQQDYDINLARDAFFNGKRATILQKTNDGKEVVKMRLDVGSLGTSSKVRVIFIAVIADGLIQFVELYSKNDKNREDKSRINKYL